MRARIDTQPSTSHQRLYCRGQLYRAELPTHQVTVMHRDLFRKAGIEWRDGQDMNALLEVCTRKQVSALIDAVTAYLGETEEAD